MTSDYLAVKNFSIISLAFLKVKKRACLVGEVHLDKAQWRRLSITLSDERKINLLVQWKMTKPLLAPEPFSIHTQAYKKIRCIINGLLRFKLARHESQKRDGKLKRIQ